MGREMKDRSAGGVVCLGEQGGFVVKPFPFFGQLLHKESNGWGNIGAVQAL